MFLAERMMGVLDSTAIALHLIYDRFRIGNESIGIFTVETIQSLKQSKFFEIISVYYNVVFPIYKRNFKDPEINILKLPEKKIDQNKGKNTYV